MRKKSFRHGGTILLSCLFQLIKACAILKKESFFVLVKAQGIVCAIASPYM